MLIVFPSAGIVNSIGWLLWCGNVHIAQPYVWRAATSILLLNGLVLLELLDFPPIAWTFDAHSLWHAGTAPIALLWYR